MLKKCEKPIFIVCSASSGSTMLSNMLSRHPDIFIGPELYVFNKQQLYKNYKFVQKNIRKWLNKGLLTKGQINQNIFFFNKEAYDLTNESIINIFTNSKNINEVANNIFSRILNKYDKKIWGEKTGSNAYCMDEILKVYPDAKIIHLIRDPFDTIKSISKRNSNIYHATTHYLYNNLAALRYEELSNYKMMRYEDIVSDFETQIKKIFDFSEVENFNVLDTNNDYWKKEVNNEKNTHKTWTNSPFDKPNPTSIGKGRSECTEEDLSIIKSIKLNNRGAKLLNLDLDNNLDFTIEYLCNKFGYNCKILEPINSKNIFFEKTTEYIKSCRRTKNCIDTLPLFESTK